MGAKGKRIGGLTIIILVFFFQNIIVGPPRLSVQSGYVTNKKKLIKRLCAHTLLLNDENFLVINKTMRKLI